MYLPDDLPPGIEWFTVDGERVFPEFDGNGAATGRLFSYLITHTGERIASFGIAFDEHSDLSEVVASSLAEFQAALSQPGEKDSHAPA